jgi:nucleotide-binding universal stress UspA family protein
VHPKDILIALSARDQDDPARDYAIGMAAQYQAHLTAVAYALVPEVPFSIYPEFVSGLAQQFRAEAKQAVEATRKRFEHAARGEEIEHSFEQATCPLLDAAADFMFRLRTADVAVMTQHKRGELERVGDVFFASALFHSGRPVLLVPRGYQAGFSSERVLIAWDASVHATRAVAAAVPFLVESASIRVLTVKEATKGEDFRESALVQHLRRHKLQVEPAQRADRGIPEAILREVESFRATLVVMGAYRHSRIREFVFGGATRLMLDKMAAPVLFAH